MDERAEFDKMSDHELKSYWNILQFPCHRIGAQTSNQHERHVRIVDELLAERGIAHEVDKRTVLAVA